MICPACNAANDTETEECFGCGRSLFAVTQGRVLAGRYEIRRPIGQGGMGRVYEALDRVLKERVAVKVLRPQFAREPDMARRFLSEIRLARRITHPNVCRLHEYGESEGIRYLCMELVDGVNLKEVLRARRLGTEDAYDVAVAAAEGLGAVHAQGVIHRDFKSANIMVDARGQVKVMDFGIAKEVGSDTTGVSLAGHVMGTPEYMSPEHAQGGRVDYRSDIYALGCVIFEIFAGRALFQGSSAIDTLRRHLHEPLPFTNDAGPLVPEPLVPVLTRALAKKPDERYSSVADLVEDMRAARAATALHAVLGDEYPLAELIASPTPPPALEAPPSLDGVGPTRALTPKPRPSGPRPLPAPPRRGWIAPAGAAALVAVGALAWWSAQEPAPVANAAVPTTTPATLAARPVETPAPLPTAPPVVEPSPPRSERLRPAPTAVARVAPPPTTVAASVPPTTRPVQLAVLSPSPEPPVASAEEFGVLKLLVVPPSEVVIDGKSLGVVSTHVLRLAPGSHAVRVENSEYHPYNRKVTVQAGVSDDLVLDLSEKGVRRSR
jgi:serine/threonine protein kinase